MKAVILSIGLTLSCISVADPTVTSIVIFLPCQHCTRSSHDSSRLRARRRSTHDHRSAPAIRVIHDFHLSSDRRAQILSGCRFCFTLDERLSEGAFAVLLPRSRCISFSRGRSIRELKTRTLVDDVPGRFVSRIKADPTRRNTIECVGGCGEGARC